MVVQVFEILLGNCTEKIIEYSFSTYAKFSEKSNIPLVCVSGVKKY